MNCVLTELAGGGYRSIVAGSDIGLPDTADEIRNGAATIDQRAQDCAPPHWDARLGFAKAPERVAKLVKGTRTIAVESDGCL